MRKIIFIGFLILITGCQRESIYPPPSPSASSDNSKEPDSIPTPLEVMEAQKNIVSLTVKFELDSNPIQKSFGIISPPILSWGTAFMLAPGVFVSARHILIDNVFRLRSIGWQFEIDPHSGLPKNKNNQYNYAFLGTTNINSHTQDFILTPIAMGGLGMHQDYIVFKGLGYPDNLKPLSTEELKNEEIVYSSGYVPINSNYPTPDGTYKEILSDIVKENFRGQVSEVIKTMPINAAGVSTYYRIRGDLIPGYSGGPILNTKGKVGAMTIEMLPGMLRPYYYGVAIKDVEDFVSLTKKKGLLK